MTFDRFLGEFRGELELQTFLYRYGRSCPFVNLLGLITLKAEYIFTRGRTTEIVVPSRASRSTSS